MHTIDRSLRRRHPDTRKHCQATVNEYQMTASVSPPSLLIIGGPDGLRDSMLAAFGASAEAVGLLDRGEGFKARLKASLENLSDGPGNAVVVNILEPQPGNCGRLETMDLDIFRRLLDEQIGSTWHSLDVLVPALGSAGDGGVVINVLPVTAGAFCFVESLSMLGRCAAIEGAGTSPVRVHTVTVQAHVPPAEAASAVAFLCSERGSYMSGNVLRLGEGR